MAYFWLKSHIEVTSKDSTFYSFKLKGKSNIMKELKSHKDATWKKLDKENLPPGKGVYIFIVKDIKTKKREVAYIGCSKNMHIRLYSHYIYRFLTEMLESNFTTQAFYWKTQNYKTEEAHLIYKFKPFLNDVKYPSKFKIENDKLRRNRLRAQYAREQRLANLPEISNN